MKIILPLNRIEVQYRNGMTIQRLARFYYVSYYCMYTNLRELGIVRNYRMEPIDKKTLKEQYCFHHFTIAELAEFYGTNTTKIIQKLREYGIKRKNGGNRNPRINRMTPVAVHYLHDTGMTIEKISRQLKVSKRYVSYALKIDVEEIRKQI